MKIAETILEFKESTKESQGDIFSRAMVSVAHGRNALENISLKAMECIGICSGGIYQSQVFFKVLHMRFLKFYVRALFLEFYVYVFLKFRNTHLVLLV